jgi:hypothetical protein
MFKQGPHRECRAHIVAEKERERIDHNKKILFELYRYISRLKMEYIRFGS